MYYLKTRQRGNNANFCFYTDFDKKLLNIRNIYGNEKRKCGLIYCKAKSHWALGYKFFPITPTTQTHTYTHTRVNFTWDKKGERKSKVKKRHM